MLQSLGKHNLDRSPALINSTAGEREDKKQASCQLKKLRLHDFRQNLHTKLKNKRDKQLHGSPFLKYLKSSFL